MDPTTLALINAGSNVLGKALSPASAAPAQSGASGFLDGSGWVVSTGGKGFNSGGSAAGVPWLYIAAAAGLAWMLAKG